MGVYEDQSADEKWQCEKERRNGCSAFITRSVDRLQMADETNVLGVQLPSSNLEEDAAENYFRISLDLLASGVGAIYS
ncbi:hypothetical protein OUZ56_018902 [Daphnia magna]|uniref:Uncharacterized protein n=1 Tax=Daphnia magna TaxID=35525 RepID=A0ABQ9ZA43_9CRUS|nr:hypothetical protein OUZ56_018902 [Daphnia magna]